MRFDLTDLKLFLHVVEAGSITAGADRMHLAVAAASTRIRNMELELGTPLLNRERQGVHPTPAGRTLVLHARVLLLQAERMRVLAAATARCMRSAPAVMLPASTTCRNSFRSVRSKRMNEPVRRIAANLREFPGVSTRCVCPAEWRPARRVICRRVHDACCSRSSSSRLRSTPQR
jgi:molybdenum-dependent DNA-binding transcriptional regulator ModE